MEIAYIKGDTVVLLYHPADVAAEVGQQFTVMEIPEKTEGLVVQVISNESVEYAGLQQEMIQRILEQRVAQRTEALVDRERGMGEIKSLKLANTKIRKRVRAGEWFTWDGWIPTRNVQVSRLEANDLLGHVLPVPQHAIGPFARFGESPIELDGPRLNMVNVIAGVKGSGKSHLAKHLVLALSQKHVPCIIFDINGEYVQLPRARVLRWGDNFVPDLAEVGYEMLSLVVKAIYPLPATSESVFEGGLPVYFGQRRVRCEGRHEEFAINLNEMRERTWSNNEYVQQAIDDRLRVVGNLGLFLRTDTRGAVAATNLSSAYENACDGRPIVFDMRPLSTTLQHALVKAMTKNIEDLCSDESGEGGAGRFPFVFFEEAHFYVTPDAIMNIITRGRHIGMASVFVTNTPQSLPDAVFRQLDNLLLLALTHKDDIRSVSKNSFTDEDTIESFATRMPERHALIVGNVTDRYPLVLSIDALPEGVPPTGETRSTWDRFSTEKDDSPSPPADESQAGATSGQ